MPCTLRKVSLNDTVLWRRASTNEVLTAGSSRVTADKRINILHDKRKYIQFTFIYCPVSVQSTHPLYTSYVLHTYLSVFIVVKKRMRAVDEKFARKMIMAIDRHVARMR